MPDPRDEFTLLCETCGYAVEGLPPEGHCPECGRPIAESDPDRRPGTPWQADPDPGTVAWWRTATLVLRHPIRTWDWVRIEPGRGGFGRVNCWIAGILVGLVATVRLVREAGLAAAAGDGGPFGAWSDALGMAAFGGGVIVLAFGATWGLSTLTWIEYLGVRFFGNRRGWRVTPAVANTVCGHASVGWLIAAVLWAGCALAVDTGWARWMIAELGLPRPPPSVWLRGLAPLSGFLLGLLVFEFLVYFGVRRNRFANRARPATVQHRPQP